MVGVGPHHWRPPGHPPWQPVVNQTPTSKEFIPVENKDSKLQAHGKNFSNLEFSNLHLVSSNLSWLRSLNTKHNLFPRIINKNKKIILLKEITQKCQILTTILPRRNFLAQFFASTIPCWQAHSGAKYNLLFQIFAKNIICPQQANYWQPIQTICKTERKMHQAASFFGLKLWSQQQTWQSNWSIYWFSILQVLVRQPGTNFLRRFQCGHMPQAQSGYRYFGLQLMNNFSRDLPPVCSTILWTGPWPLSSTKHGKPHDCILCWGKHQLLFSSLTSKQPHPFYYLSVKWECHSNNSRAEWPSIDQSISNWRHHHPHISKWRYHDSDRCKNPPSSFHNTQDSSKKVVTRTTHQ